MPSSVIQRDFCAPYDFVDWTVNCYKQNPMAFWKIEICVLRESISTIFKLGFNGGNANRF